VERIARVLDHKVDLRSQVGRGSRFSVEVPLSNAKPTVQPQREAVGIDSGQLAGMTVLCIDNERQILDGMEILLGGWGCKVMTAPDLKRAEATVEKSKAVLHGLLVDYHLDDSTGIKAIAELRRRFGPDLPAILITADRSPHVREEARMNDVQLLYKPLKPAAMRALIAQWRMHRVAAAE
jgi:CheY-like chemotaxis protein